jgi:pimeloyl-ACP methyl ester carboxylesterase
MRNTGKNLSTSINGLKVGYCDEGPLNAPTILFIHGFPLNKSMWNPQMDALKDSYRVIAYDIRGHGDSDPGDENFSMELFAHDLLFFMDALNLDKPALCGLSMGGYIALNALEKFPGHFSALVLSDTQCSADTPDMRAKRMAEIESIQLHGVEQYAAQRIKALFTTKSFTTRQKEIRDTSAMICGLTEQSLAYTLFALSERKEMCSKLQDIEIPVLIMVGKEDKITPLATAQWMHQNIQGSILKVIDEAGHLANLENASAFNVQLKNFIHPKTHTATLPGIAHDLILNGI